MSLPTTLTINAWTGESVASSNVSTHILEWLLGTEFPKGKGTLVPKDPSLADWQDPGVGWGLVLPYRKDLTPAQLATGDDAPEPIRALLKARDNAPVYRYLPDSPYRFTLLRNYTTGQDITISTLTPNGVAAGALPYYLLIYGTPAEIPWELQYVLNTARATGRLDLTGNALANYVQALLTNWQDASAQIDQAVVWAVDFGEGDMTRLMRNAIAKKIYDKWCSDATLQGKAVFIDGAVNQALQATASNLYTTLGTHKPALVVTTSHGMTGPLDNLTVMKAQLGLLVDQDRQLLDPNQLLAGWQPDGAIWYAHACCSAGSAATTAYDGLLDAGSTIDRVLKGVAALGSLVAPLPDALLGAKKPLRAFIGHVEPTFDWTLMQQATGQFLTSELPHILYHNVYTQEPIGLAFYEYYRPIGTLESQYEEDKTIQNANTADMRDTLLSCQLSSRDIRSMVILGDPTAILPPLP